MATTIVNTPAADSNANDGSGFLVSVILIVIFAVFVFYFGVPYFRQMTSKGVQINIPKDINVNVQQTK